MADHDERPRGSIPTGAGWPLCWAFSLLLLALLDPTSITAGVDPLIDTRPPDWTISEWLNSPPLDLADLEGRVVLVRWWTAPSCPFCAATAPALNEFWERYRERGLTVIGLYHHKARSPLEIADVERWATDFGFTFPIGIDREWTTLGSWWLETGERSYTSVSFLLDRRGRVRHIHPGGQYAPGEPDHERMQQWIEKLLEEDPPSSAGKERTAPPGR